MNAIQLDPETSSQLRKTVTISDKIRYLDRKGFARAEIARILGKRYQHVRNVLEADKKKLLAERSGKVAADTPAVATIGRTGELVIPAEMVKAMALGVERKVTLRLIDGELRVISPGSALAQTQALLRGLLGNGTSLAEELISERRAEAAAEGHRR